MRPSLQQAILLVALALPACATGSTLRSGVGDLVLEHAPYYAGTAANPTDTARIGHLPVAYQRGATQAPIFEPVGDADSPVAAFLAAMTAYVESLSITTSVPAAALRGTPPDVRFSCETDPASAADDCATGPGAVGRDDIRMLLAVGRPSAEWTVGAAQAMELADVGSVLVITLEIGQYRVRQRGLRGDKEVELGTDHSRVPRPAPCGAHVTIVAED